jgi:hypothetical protein
MPKPSIQIESSDDETTVLTIAFVESGLLALEIEDRKRDHMTSALIPLAELRWAVASLESAIKDENDADAK